MELDRKQPSGNGLREALSPWFDHGAAWLVLLGIGLSAFSAIRGYLTGGRDDELVTLFTVTAATLAAIAVTSRTATLEELKPVRRRAGRWLAWALAFQLVATLLVPTLRQFDFPAVQGLSGFLQFAFFPCAAMAATSLLLSTRGKLFSPQFWLEATLVALCVGTVLWLSLPHDLAADALPARGGWTVGLDAVIGVMAAILLLRRSDWRGWPALVTCAFALGGLVGARLLEAHAAAAGLPARFAAPLQVAALAALAVAAHFDYLRAVRSAPPMDAEDRVSPVAPLVPYGAL